MVPRLHQSSGYIKRKLHVWRAKKCNALVGAETVLTSVRPESTTLHGVLYRAETGNMRNFGLTNPMVPRLHQSNGHIKRKLRVWRAKKCNALVGADTVLTSARLQNTTLHGVLYKAETGNMQNFGLTNPHGTAFVPKQWLY